MYFPRFLFRFPHQNKKLRAQFPIHRKRVGTEQERQIEEVGAIIFNHRNELKAY